VRQVVRFGAPAVVAAEVAEADLALDHRKVRLRTIELLKQRN
jgi:hypothetical protein